VEGIVFAGRLPSARCADAEGLLSEAYESYFDGHRYCLSARRKGPDQSAAVGDDAPQEQLPPAGADDAFLEQNLSPGAGESYGRGAARRCRLDTPGLNGLAVDPALPGGTRTSCREMMRTECWYAEGAAHRLVCYEGWATFPRKDEREPEITCGHIRSRRSPRRPPSADLLTGGRVSEIPRTVYKTASTMLEVDRIPRELGPPRPMPGRAVDATRRFGRAKGHARQRFINVTRRCIHFNSAWTAITFHPGDACRKS